MPFMSTGQNVAPAPNYLAPVIAHSLPWQRIPIVRATDTALQGYGRLVTEARDNAVEIVRWPKQGWRPVDDDSGNEGGTVEGEFVSEWRGDILFGRNTAVGGEYVLAYAVAPADARTDHARRPERMLLWHANYHPDGGQFFFPLDRKPFLVPLALPGDDVKPSDFIAFYCDGDCGLYIHPNIWHDGVMTTHGAQRFFDKQGAVHARVSVDFGKEFGILLEIPLKP